MSSEPQSVENVKPRAAQAVGLAPECKIARDVIVYLDALVALTSEGADVRYFHIRRNLFGGDDARSALFPVDIEEVSLHGQVLQAEKPADRSNN